MFSYNCRFTHIKVILTINNSLYYFKGSHTEAKEASIFEGPSTSKMAITHAEDKVEEYLLKTANWENDTGENMSDNTDTSSMSINLDFSSASADTDVDGDVGAMTFSPDVGTESDNTSPGATNANTDTANTSTNTDFGTMSFNPYVGTASDNTYPGATNANIDAATTSTNVDTTTTSLNTKSRDNNTSANIDVTGDSNRSIITINDFSDDTGDEEGNEPQRKKKLRVFNYTF